jgi:acyl carrier protein
MQNVEAIVSNALGVERNQVGPDSTLSQLGADSVDVVEAVLSLEECFNVDLGDAVLEIELPTPETAKLKNLRDIADLIQCETVGMPVVQC